MAQPAHASDSFSRYRRWAMGLNVLVSIVSLVAIVAMVNYIGSRHYRRWHTPQGVGQRLSPLTREVLVGFTNEVQVTVLFDPEESTLFNEVKALLTEYELACPRFRTEYVNYGRNPGRADWLKAKYRLHVPDTLLVVLDATGRPPFVLRERELSEYDLSAALRGEEIRRTGFKGEQLVTSALIALADPRPVRALFVTGHGEPPVEGDDRGDGYQQFAQLLAEKNIRVESFSLSSADIPADCQLLIVAGPRTAFSPAEVERLETYLRGGGRAFFALFSRARKEARSTGLERLLRGWGVQVGDDLVMDRTLSESGEALVMLTGNFGAHRMVRPLVGSRVALVTPCSVRALAGESKAGDAPRVEELVFTSPQGTAVSVRGGVLGSVQTNGIVPLAVAVEQGVIAGISPDRSATRLVVVGEAAFLTNLVIDYEANRDFANLAVNWLLDRLQLVELGARPVQEYRVSLTRSQMKAAAWLLLGILPGAVLSVGLLVWLRRRK